MNEIIFSYNNTRCHATIVDQNTFFDSDYIGSINGYDVYKTYGMLFNQFGFVAVKGV